MVVPFEAEPKATPRLSDVMAGAPSEGPCRSATRSAAIWRQAWMAMESEKTPWKNWGKFSNQHMDITWYNHMHGIDMVKYYGYILWWNMVKYREIWWNVSIWMTIWMGYVMIFQHNIKVWIWYNHCNSDWTWREIPTIIGRSQCQCQQRPCGLICTTHGNIGWYWLINEDNVVNHIWIMWLISNYINKYMYGLPKYLHLSVYQILDIIGLCWGSNMI